MMIAAVVVGRIIIILPSPGPEVGGKGRVGTSDLLFHQRRSDGVAIFLVCYWSIFNQIELSLVEKDNCEPLNTSRLREDKYFKTFSK